MKALFLEIAVILSNCSQTLPFPVMDVVASANTPASLQTFILKFCTGAGDRTGGINVFPGISTLLANPCDGRERLKRGACLGKELLSNRKLALVGKFLISAVFFSSDPLSVLLSLSELKEKRI